MAPSPTGEFHIGGMRTLLYNYVLAKNSGGEFILRIEDTDRERLVVGAVERLVKVIKDYGLDWDEGPEKGGTHAPYVQSQRLDLYIKYALELIQSGHAYYCFCTKERLDTLREQQHAQGFPSTKYDKHCLGLSKEEVAKKLASHEPYVIRLKVPANQEVSFEDKTLGRISFPTNDIDDQVLIKSDGFPTYHLAVAVDDHLMEINYVLRGMEWLPSTPKHILLYQAFGWDLPTYAHLPLLKEIGDTKKLSKRMGSVSAVEFLAEGYLPEALLNFLMFLGWNPGTEKEIYSLEEFIKDFSIDKIHKTDLVVFDRDKLSWYNGYYIRQLSVPDLWKKLVMWANEFGASLAEGDFDQEYVLKVLSLVQDRMKTFKEFVLLTKYFFEAPKVDLLMLNKQSTSPQRSQLILGSFQEMYRSVEKGNWQTENLDTISHQMIAQKDFKPKEAFMTLRVAITGETATPPIFEILSALGKDEVLSRLDVQKNEGP